MSNLQYWDSWNYGMKWNCIVAWYHLPLLYQLCTTKLSRPTFTPRLEISVEGISEDLVAQLHMPTLGDPEIEFLLFIQKAQTDPIFTIDIPFLQICYLFTRSIDLGKKGTLLGDDRLVICKHEHGEPAQFLDILLVGLILRLPLIVDVSQKIAILKVILQILRVAIVLRGHQSALRKGPPRVALEKAAPRPTQPIRGRAFLKLADPVVLASKGHEILYPRIVAAFNVRAQELAALGKAEGVDGRGS